MLIVSIIDLPRSDVGYRPLQNVELHNTIILPPRIGLNVVRHLVSPGGIEYDS
jgi:hypothetical protein